MNKFNFLKKIILIICFFTISCSSTKHYIGGDQTIFVLFENSIYNKKYLDKNQETISLGKYIFSVYENQKTSYPTGNITFSSKIYKDFDQMELDKPVPIFNVNKEFVKNNKDKIISLDYMKQLGYEKFLQLFKDAKHIFLIDQTEVIDNKLTIKEVFLQYIGEE